MAEGGGGTSKMSGNWLSYVIFISVQVSHYFYINFFIPSYNLCTSAFQTGKSEHVHFPTEVAPAADIFNALNIAEGNLSVNFAAHMRSISASHEYQRAEKMYLESLAPRTVSPWLHFSTVLNVKNSYPMRPSNNFFNNLTPSSLEIMKNDH